MADTKEFLASGSDPISVTQMHVYEQMDGVLS